MTAADLHHFVLRLRRTAEAGPSAGPADAELLQRVRDGGDGAAFETLVRRHGGGVLAACRKGLSSEADIEDAFQATFLVLWRSAGSVRRGQALGGFLAGVARRVALKARARAARRRHVEQDWRPPESETSDLSWREACAILHQELDRLPEAYRLPLRLCYLEGKSRDEAARQLGWKEGELRGRLARGRDQLKSRLTRRGVTLSAGLLAALHGSAEAAGLSSALIRATVRAAEAGCASTAVTDLALQGSSAMLSAKVKLFAALVVLAGVVAGVSGYRSSGAAPPPVPSVRKAEPNEARTPAPAAAEQADEDRSMTVAGRVLGPDGKPLAGAKLFVPRLKKNPPTVREDIVADQVGTSGADGRFEVAYKDSVRRQVRGYLVAYADGLGVDWIELSAEKPGADVVLRLVKDQPISGRILDTEGKPVAGVTVGVGAVYVPQDDKLDDYLAGWKKNWRDTVATPVKRLYMPLAAVTGTATTDRDGRFTIRGAGVERIVHLSVQSRGIGQMTPYVLTRAGFDPKPYNEAALGQEPAEFRRKGQLPILYGPEATLVAETGKVVEGQVTDLATGKPLRGCRVQAYFGFGDGVQALTDADGNYRLEGLPQDKGYQVHVMPPPDSAYLTRFGAGEATPGAAPVRIDVSLVKGVVVTGRVIDRQTGKGLQAGIRFAPLPDNKHFGRPGFDGYRADRTMQSTDEEGRFRVATIPGKSLLMVQVHAREKIDGLEISPYRMARPDPDYKDLFKHDKDDDTWTFTSAGGLEFLSTENVVKVVDLKEDGGEVRLDLPVERGVTGKILVQDADGKPLAGVVVAGLTDQWPVAYLLKTMDAPVTVWALDPERPRRLVFLHPDKKQGGVVTLRGDEKEPVVVKLAPLGAVSGRFLEIEGGPLAGAEVSLNPVDQTTSELYRYLERTTKPVKTDQEGRFTLPGIVPGVKFSLQTRKGASYYVGEPRIGLRQVEAGQTLDLGERKLKPQN